jgi:hypothetical protein
MKYVKDSPTSEEAAAFAEGFSGHAREQVYLYLLRNGPCTDDEMQQALGMKHQTLGPRRIELVEANMVEDTGLTRPTSSGCQATLWRVRAPYMASVFLEGSRRAGSLRAATRALCAAARAYSEEPSTTSARAVLDAALRFARVDAGQAPGPRGGS